MVQFVVFTQFLHHTLNDGAIFASKLLTMSRALGIFAQDLTTVAGAVFNANVLV